MTGEVKATVEQKEDKNNAATALVVIILCWSCSWGG